MLSSFIHSKIVLTRVKSLPNDRQGRSRRKYSVPETAVWPKMFHVNRQRRHGQCLLHYLACLFKFRSRPHRSGCAFHSLSSFLFFTNGDRSVRRVFFSAVQPPHKNGVGTLWPNLNRLSRLVPCGKGILLLQYSQELSRFQIRPRTISSARLGGPNFTQ